MNGMSFGQRMREQRKALGISRTELAQQLGVSPSAIGNYEQDTSFPKEPVLLRLFDCLETDPNTLFQDHFFGGNGSQRPGAGTAETLPEFVCAGKRGGRLRGNRHVRLSG